MLSINELEKLRGLTNSNSNLFKLKPGGRWPKSKRPRQKSLCNLIANKIIILYGSWPWGCAVVDLELLRSGGKNLHDTSAYPRSFGDHVARLHMAHTVPWLNLMIVSLNGLDVRILAMILAATPAGDQATSSSTSSLQRCYMDRFVHDRCGQPATLLKGAVLQLAGRVDNNYELYT